RCLQHGRADGEGSQVLGRTVFGVDGRDGIHLVRRVRDGAVLRIVRGRGGQRRAPGRLLKRQTSTNAPRRHPLRRAGGGAALAAARNWVEERGFRGALSSVQAGAASSAS